MFIGDGMSHGQTQLASYYLDSLANDPDADILVSEPQLSFMDFDSVGVTTTYDSTSFAPDSASTATSLATGEKTYSETGVTVGTYAHGVGSELFDGFHDNTDIYASLLLQSS